MIFLLNDSLSMHPLCTLAMDVNSLEEMEIIEQISVQRLLLPKPITLRPFLDEWMERAN